MAIIPSVEEYSLQHALYMKLILSFTFLILASGKAQAATLKEYSKVIPQLLIVNGISQAGGIRISDLSAELDQVKWETTDKPIAKGSGKPRFACNYFIKDKSVICNSEATSQVNLPLVTLHEGLGALGYMDEDYQMSAALSIHALSKSSETILGVDEYLTNFTKRTKDETYEVAAGDGGGTSVGGGGDSVGITIKTMGVATLVSLIAMPSFNLGQREKMTLAIKRMMAASFENNTNAVDTLPVFKNIKNQEVILIPYADWTWIQMNPNSPDLLSHIAVLFDSIFDHFLKPL